MQYSSIELKKNNFIHSSFTICCNNDVILETEENILLFKKALKKIFVSLDSSKENIFEYINSQSNCEFIDSNENLEVFVEVMKKYGLKERFIIKEILGGENLKGITYTDSLGNEDYIPPDIKGGDTFVFKIPITISKTNSIRILFVMKVKKEKNIIYPCFIDFNHCIYSSNKIKRVEGNGGNFEKIFLQSFLKI